MSQLIKIDSSPLCQALATGQEYNWLVPKTVNEAQKGLQISSIRKDHEKDLNVMLICLITDCVNFLGGMDDRLIGMLITQIKEKYWYLNIEEIAYIMHRAISGYYKIYGKLSPVMIMGWLNEYDVSERTDYYRSESLKHKEPNDRYFETKEKKDLIESSQLYKETFNRNKIIHEAKCNSKK